MVSISLWDPFIVLDVRLSRFFASFGWSPCQTAGVSHIFDEHCMIVAIVSNQLPLGHLHASLRDRSFNRNLAVGFSRRI